MERDPGGVELRRVRAGDGGVRLLVLAPGDALACSWRLEDGSPCAPEESDALWSRHQPALRSALERLAGGPPEGLSSRELSRVLGVPAPRLLTLAEDAAAHFGVELPGRGTPGRWKPLPRPFALRMAAYAMPLLEGWTPSKEAAAACRVSVSLVNQLCAAGELEARRVLGRWHLAPGALAALEARAATKRGRSGAAIERDGRTWIPLVQAGREAARLRAGIAGTEGAAPEDRWYKRLLYAVDHCPDLGARVVEGVRCVDRRSLDLLLDAATVAEAAEASGLSPYLVRRAMAEGRLPVVVIGSTRHTSLSAAIGLAGAPAADGEPEVPRLSPAGGDGVLRVLRQKRGDDGRLRRAAEDLRKARERLGAAEAERDRLRGELARLKAAPVPQPDEPKSFRLYWGEPKKVLARLLNWDSGRREEIERGHDLLSTLRDLKGDDPPTELHLAPEEDGRPAAPASDRSRITELEARMEEELHRLQEYNRKLKSDLSDLVEGPKSFRLYWGKQQVNLDVPELLRRNAELQLEIAGLRRNLMQQEREGAALQARLAGDGRRKAGRA